MSHQVLARKWRPKAFNEIVGQQHAVRALTNALNSQQLHHAYLFTGTRGVGKTTIARILAKGLNCEKGISAEPCGQCASCLEIDSGRAVDVMEIDAASRTRVEDTRELLDNVQYAPSNSRFKIYLIDEVHMLSTHSFNALLKTLEEPPEHVKFLLATTDPQKLPATVLSRCLQFHLMQMPEDQIADHLAHILKTDDIVFEMPALHLLGDAANGSMRDALSLLDQSISYGNRQVLLSDVRVMLSCIDAAYLIQIIEALIQQDGNKLFDAISNLHEQGVDFMRALNQLLKLFHQIHLCQLVGDAAISADKKEILQQLSLKAEPRMIQLFYQIGVAGMRDLSFAPTPKIGFEMIVLKMLSTQLSGGKTVKAPEKQPDKRVNAQEENTITPSVTNNRAPHRKMTIETLSPQVKEDIKPVDKAITPKESNVPMNETVNVQNSTLKPVEGVKKSPQDWQALLNNLKLTGAAFALAQNCSLKSLNDTHLELRLDQAHRLLLNDSNMKRLTDATSSALGRRIQVNILIDDEDAADTPANLEKKAATAQKNAAKECIYSDPIVQAMIGSLGAEVIESSIQTCDKKED